MSLFNVPSQKAKIHAGKLKMESAANWKKGTIEHLLFLRRPTQRSRRGGTEFFRLKERSFRWTIKVVKFNWNVWKMWQLKHFDQTRNLVRNDCLRDSDWSGKWMTKFSGERCSGFYLMDDHENSYMETESGLRKLRISSSRNFWLNTCDAHRNLFTLSGFRFETHLHENVSFHTFTPHACWPGVNSCWEGRNRAMRKIC